MNFRRYLPRISLRLLFIFILIIAAGSAWYAQRRNWEIQRTAFLRRLESEYVLERDKLSCKITPFAESRSFARTIFGEHASPAIQKIEIGVRDLHSRGVILAKFTPKPPADWFDYGNVPELETLWVSDYHHVASIPSAKYLNELQEFESVSFVDSYYCPRERDQLVSDYIAAFPKLPRLKYFQFFTYKFNDSQMIGPLRGNTKYLTGKDLQTLFSKAPALEGLLVCVNNLDEQTLTAFEPLKDLKTLIIHLREPDAEKYLGFVQSLLQLPRLEELYVSNICSDLYARGKDSSYQSDCAAFREGMANSSRWLEIHHPTLKLVTIFEVKRVQARNCPLLEKAQFPSKDNHPETKQSNCPKLEFLDGLYPDGMQN